MAKYIKADKLIDEIIFNEEGEGIIGSKEVIDIIQNMPSADVRENIHGEWKHLGGDEWVCSECEEINELLFKTDFCPYCGADMRERRETDE